jgi:uncharacterized membrane protein
MYTYPTARYAYRYKKPTARQTTQKDKNKNKNKLTMMWMVWGIQLLMPFVYVQGFAPASRPLQGNMMKRPRLPLSGRQSASPPFYAIKVPLIAASDTWGNLATLTFSATISQVLGKTTSVGRLLGPPVTAMAITFLLASFGVLNPGGTTASKSLQLLSLQLATPSILLGADLRDCFSRCGPLLLSFLVASLASILACLVGWYISGNLLTSALGKDSLIIAGALLAKNVGGGINYIAVCRSLSASPQAIAAGLTIDNIFALIYFPVTSWLGSRYPDPDVISPKDQKPSTMDSIADESSSPGPQPPITIQNVSSVLFLSCALLWLGERIAGESGALPCCTLLTVLFASWAPSKWMAPLQPAAEVMGTMCLYMFFSTAGKSALDEADMDDWDSVGELPISHCQICHRRSRLGSSALRQSFLDSSCNILDMPL